MATYITKRRQSLSCSARSFSDIPAMKKLSAAKLRWQNSFSQFRRTTREWSHSCISLLTGMASTHAYINFFSFWLINLYNDKKWKSDSLGSSYVEVNGACKRNLLLLIQGHVASKFENNAATECHVWKITQCCVTLRPMFLIYGIPWWRNMARPKSRDFFSWRTDFLGNCSHEGQIHSSGSSSVFAQYLNDESRGLILLGYF